MLKRVMAGLMLVLLIVIFGCRRSAQPAPAPKNQMETPSSRLLAYFPKTTGTVWEYDGMAEYGSRMTLISRRNQTEPPRTIYTLEGNVADMSDGESTANFHFKLTWHFTTDSVYEEVLESGTPFPHSLKYLRMLALPLKKGHSWEQKLTVNGQSQLLKAEITAVGSEEIFGRDTGTVTVRYRVPMANMPDGIYEEVRVFAKGYGIIRFEKTFGPDQTDRFNYFLRAINNPSKQ